MVGEDIVSIRRVMRANSGLCVVLIVYIVVHSLMFIIIAKGLEQVVLRACGRGGRNAISDKESWIVRFRWRFIRVSQLLT